jgi:hypothetical protein
MFHPEFLEEYKKLPVTYGKGECVACGASFMRTSNRQRFCLKHKPRRWGEGEGWAKEKIPDKPCVYYLWFNSHPFFKIGMSKNVERYRLTSLEDAWGGIDSDRSGFFLLDVGCIRSFEHLIHYKFKKYKVVFPESEDRDGHTEMFDKIIWKDAVQSIDTLGRWLMGDSLYFRNHAKIIGTSETPDKYGMFLLDV